MKKFVSFLLILFLISSLFVTVINSISASSELVENSWNVKTPMKYERRCGFAVLDGKIYAIGGSYTDIVERYDTTTDTWTTLTPMPTSRDVSPIVYQGQIYCIGGTTNDVGPSPAIVRSLNVVEAYDPTTDSWSQKASVPLEGKYSFERYYYAAMKAIVVNEQLFVIAESGELYLYNSTSDSWNSKIIPVETNLYSSLYVVDEQLFFITSSREMYLYNPVTDSWTKKTSPPPSDSNYVFYPFITVVDNKIIIGDHQKTVASPGSVNLNLRIYDPKTDVWSERKTNSKSVIFYGGSMFVGATSGKYAPKNLYIFGYEQTDVNDRDSFQAFTWIYNPITDVWSTSTAIAEFRNVLNSQLLVVDDVFYLIRSTSMDQYIPVDYNPQGYPTNSPSNTNPLSSAGTSTNPSDPEYIWSFFVKAVVAVIVITVCSIAVLFFYLRNKKVTSMKSLHKVLVYDIFCRKTIPVKRMVNG